MTDPTPPLNLALTLGMIGFLLAFVGLLWLRREERIRAEQIEAAAKAAANYKLPTPSDLKEEFEDWLTDTEAIWTAPEPPDTLYGLPNLRTRILHDLDDGSEEDSIGDRPGPMIW